MKKLLVVFPLLFSFHFAEAQLQIQIQGGPKTSLTQNTGFEIHSTNSKKSWQGGAYLGYLFPNKKIVLETGLALSRFDIIIRYTPDHYFLRAKEDPELNIAYSAWQIPFRIKPNLLSSESKLQIRPLLGLLFTFKNSNKIQPKSLLDLPIDRNGYRTVKGKEDDLMILIPHTAGGANGERNFLSLEGGLEVGYTLTSSFGIIGAISYQSGLKTTDSFLVYYKYRENEMQDWRNVTTVSSRSEAINLNFGLTYSFSKRKKKTV